MAEVNDASPTRLPLSKIATRVVPDCIEPTRNTRLSFVVPPFVTLPITGAKSSATPVIDGAVGVAVSTVSV